METSLQLRIQHTPDALNHLLYGLDEAHVKQRPIAEKWSILENIAHLGRYHEVFFERMQRILKEEHLLFERYVADNDEGFAEWCKNDFNQLIQKFHSSRKSLNEFLFKLSDEQLKRNARHPAFGQMSIIGWCEFFLLHETHHYFTIFKLVPQIIAPE